MSEASGLTRFSYTQIKFIGRSSRDRTDDLLSPRQARYQAAPYSEIGAGPVMQQEIIRRNLALSPQSDKLKNVVGVQRFELWTPCSQSRCATRLRYTPTKLFIDYWYPGPDSNRHAFQREILSLLCLPFHHQGKCLLVCVVGFEPTVSHFQSEWINQIFLHTDKIHWSEHNATRLRHTP